MDIVERRRFDWSISIYNQPRRQLTPLVILLFYIFKCWRNWFYY